MIQMPDFAKAFEYENNFFLSSSPSRLGKLLAHFEFFQMVVEKPGDIIEFGVLKGCSLVRWATFRDLFSVPHSRKIIGFDSFGRFPETDFVPDQPYRQRHIEICGEESISEDQLKEVLAHKNLTEGIDLIKGDIMETLPEYLKRHPQARFSLINIDVDIYEPSKLILEVCFPRLVKGGVLLMDDYGKFPGETKAVDDYFSGTSYELQRFPFSDTPTFIVRQ